MQFFGNHQFTTLVPPGLIHHQQNLLVRPHPLFFGVDEALKGVELGGKLAVDLAEHIAEECGASLSFTPTTLVLTLQGELAIGTLHKGNTQ